jgi:lycopene cyclase domain-containing protein
MEKYYYLLINVLSILFPLLFSFEPRVTFISRWKGLLLGIGITAAVFIIWDAIFTRMGVWGFNARYLTGIEVMYLPVEEIMFFFTIPYACLFTYEAMNYYIKKDILARTAYPFSILLSALLITLGIVFMEKWYTSVTFISAGIFLFLLAYLKKPRYLSRFFVGYAVCLIPFLIVNGILTGSFIPDEIVWYNNEENLSLRIFTIPVEDTVYMLLMLLMSTSIYEAWKERNGRLTF